MTKTLQKLNRISDVPSNRISDVPSNLNTLESSPYQSDNYNLSTVRSSNNLVGSTDKNIIYHENHDVKPNLSIDANNVYPYKDILEETQNQIMGENIITGVFVVYIFHAKSNSKSLFFYLDIASNRCIFKWHIGQGAYKAFFNFLVETITKEKLSVVNGVCKKVLIPYKYLSQSTLNRMKIGYAIHFKFYLRKEVDSYIVHSLGEYLKKEMDFKIPNEKSGPEGETVNEILEKRSANLIKEFVNDNRGVKMSSRLSNIASYNKGKLSLNGINILNSKRSFNTSSKILKNYPSPKVEKLKKQEIQEQAWRGRDILNQSQQVDPKIKWAKKKELHVLDAPEVDAKQLIDDFWAVQFQVWENKVPGVIAAVQLRILTVDGMWRSITREDKVAYGDRELLGRLYGGMEEYKMKSNYADQVEITLYLSYIFLKPWEVVRSINTPDTVKATTLFQSSLKQRSCAPPNTDFKSWGEVFELGPNSYKVIEGKNFGNMELPIVYNIISLKNKNLVEIWLGAEMYDSFIDNNIHNGGKNFIRQFKDGVHQHYVNGILVTHVSPKPSWKSFKWIPKLNIKKGDDYIHTPTGLIITLDIETREVYKMLPVKKLSRAKCNTNNPKLTKIKVIEPLVISIKLPDGTIKSFARFDYISTNTMVWSVLRFLVKPELSGCKIYVHNLGKFDLLFLLRKIGALKNSSVSALRGKDGTFKSIQIKYTPKPRDEGKIKYTHNIVWYDSLAMLPSSLDALMKAFNTPSSAYKGLFPFKMLNKTRVKWEYSGDLPDIKYFHLPNKISEVDKFMSNYNNFKAQFNRKNPWVLKKQIVKYCENDVQGLYEVMRAFTTIIWDRYKINVERYPTLPSLSFAIYRAHYLKNAKIPIITDAPYEFIKNAYFGGIVDTYIPKAAKVYSSDVNSLYPSRMQSQDMPVGRYLHFYGDSPYKFDSNKFFGFVRVKVYPPEMDKPLLPYRDPNSGSVIYLNGVFEGTYFTEEIKKCMEYGYKFKVLEGLLFERKNIFKEFIDDLYQIKVNAKPGDPWYLISKLIMNSLYGRFGMDPVIPEQAVVSPEAYLEMLKDATKDIGSTLDLGESIMVEFFDKAGSLDESYNPRTPYASISVAAAISAHSRSHMARFMVEYGDSLCAIDTDGIKTTIPLADKEMGTGLGLMKDEGHYDLGVFIAPKIYSLINKTHPPVVKVKGSKNPHSFWDLNNIIYNGPKTSSEVRWMRDFSNETIIIRDMFYTLKPTHNKRQGIYTSWGEFIGTKPYRIKDGVIMKHLIPEIRYFLPQPKINHPNSEGDPENPVVIPNNHEDNHIDRMIPNIIIPKVHGYPDDE